jgi:glycosyltransferase involved in cell wall biosynthesis
VDTAPRLSLVVPAYNEERYLPRLLDSVDSARQAYGRGPNAVEVVVADNASSDRTAEIAAARGCRVTRIEKRAIAAARNGGAAIARGEIFCFTDADGRIHPGTFDAVDRAASSGRYVAGATGATLEHWTLGRAMSYAVFVPVLWLTGMDTGVVFCRREDFRAVGGYDESRLYAEDVLLLWQLRRLGRRDGRRLVRLRGVKTIASTRKFDEHGEWHYFTAMPALVWRALFRRGAANEFAERYWYRPER